MTGYDITPKDNFLESMRKKHDVNSERKELKTAPKFTMSDLEYTNMPTKISVVGPLSKPSVKPRTNTENPLQGGIPKEFRVA